MSATVTYRGVTKNYGDVPAVQGFDLEVADGEFLVLVGPSGCGKSTLLRMTAGLERITAGDLEIAGVRINDQEAGERDVAMVFQNYALYPHRSVRGNLSYALRLRHMPKDAIARKVEAVAGMLELTDLLDRRPGQLSGGQAQRVALGRAIVRQPAVFLMDEPLSNLDAKLRAQMRAELVRLHRTVKTTTIYVTHDQVEAMTMGTRIVILDKGELQQVGTPREVYHRPANLFVATFMGAPPMNVLPARLERIDGGLAAVTDGVVAPLPREVEAAVAASGSGGSERDVVLGLRPEDLRVERADSPARPDDVTVEGQVDVVELLGGEAHLHVVCGGQRITAKVAADSEPEPGTPVRLVAPGTKSYLFDAVTTQLIGTGQRAVVS